MEPETGTKRPRRLQTALKICIPAAALVLLGLLNAALAGLRLPGLPAAGDLVRVEVTDARYGETRTLVDPEDLQLAAGCLDSLQRRLWGGAAEGEPVVTLRLTRKNGKTVEIAANETTVFYRDKAYPLQRQNTFLKLTEGCFFFDRAAQVDIRRQVEEALGLDCASGEVEVWADDRENGLGETFVQLQFPAGAGPGGLADAPDWRPLPLDSDAEIFLYGKSDDTGSLGPFVELGRVPRPQNGAWFFLDRSDAKLQARGPLWSRGAIHATLAVFDSDRCVLYYMTLDS